MNYISLGYFCSVALELEKLGLRKESSPFDWLITDFSGIINAMEEKFCDLWEYSYWAQNSDDRDHYKHLKYGFQFFHDFDKYHSFSEQFSQVKIKYDRRIQRFYESIKKPTIFIRYISDEEKTNGISTELLWIEANYEKVMETIKLYNQSNEIIFIANNGVKSSKITIYNVDKDENDTVARSPIYKNHELYEYFKNADVEGRKQNLEIYMVKKRKKRFMKIPLRMLKLVRKIFCKEYIHEKCY